MSLLSGTRKNSVPGSGAALAECSAPAPVASTAQLGKSNDQGPRTCAPRCRIAKDDCGYMPSSHRHYRDRIYERIRSEAA